MYYDTEGGRTKTTPDKTFQTRNPGQNSPNINHRELRQTPCKDICMYACTTKKGGVGFKMCDVAYFKGVPRCVTKCDRGGVKIARSRDFAFVVAVEISSLRLRYDYIWPGLFIYLRSRRNYLISTEFNLVSQDLFI